MIYEDVLKQLWLRKVRYLIAGGLAVNLYGYTRLTMDIDLMIDFSDQNLLSAVAGMEACGYVPRLPVKAIHLADQKQRDEWIREKGALVFTFFDPAKPYRQVDIFLVNLVDFEEAYRRRTEKVIRDIPISIISLEDLIQLKAISGRPRDVEDLAHLRTILKSHGKSHP